MSDGIDIEMVRAHYRNMNNADLIRTVTTDVAGLTPGALQVVQEEIARRNLGENISNAVNAQNRQFTLEEIDAYCALIQDLPCPVCGSSGVQLNGTLVTEVVSFVFITQYQKNIKVACPDCLDIISSRASSRTAVTGWWSFRGMIWTIEALGSNRKSQSAHRSVTPNNALRSFVCSVIGEIEAHKDNRDLLRKMIS